jgi:oxygen-independent coproporphyrinogen-3 oxidase
MSLTLTDETISASLERVRHALDSVPTTAYSVPHVYPSAAPAYRPAPFAERERPAADRLRLYVHLPFCRYHCSFCYFAVRAGASRPQMERYVRALRRELEWAPAGTPLSQLFVGGGTPTALPPELLDEVLAAIFDRLPPRGGHVHTVETSPETVSPAHLEVLRRRGIGRASMGIQSLDQPVLDGVQRRHSGDDALRACELLAGSGLIANVDLIYGLPGQSRESFRRDLRAVASAGIHALTLYSLRVNDRTPVTKALGGEPFDLGSLMRWRAFVRRAAGELGYTQTRWHTFKRLDTAARNHERVPCFDDRMAGFQLGVGMSARSHLGYTIYRNHASLAEYLARAEAGRSPVEQIFPLDARDRRTQHVARTLGDGGALVRADYERAFGTSFDADYGALLERLARAALVEDDGRRVTLSELGGLVYDLVTLAFYPPHAQQWLRSRARHSFVRMSRSGAPAAALA